MKINGCGGGSGSGGIGSGGGGSGGGSGGGGLLNDVTSASDVVTDAVISLIYG